MQFRRETMRIFFREFCCRCFAVLTQKKGTPSFFFNMHVYFDVRHSFGVIIFRGFSFAKTGSIQVKRKQLKINTGKIRVMIDFSCLFLCTFSIYFFCSKRYTIPFIKFCIVFSLKMNYRTCVLESKHILRQTVKMNCRIKQIHWTKFV